MLFLHKLLDGRPVGDAHGRVEEFPVQVPDSLLELLLVGRDDPIRDSGEEVRRDLAKHLPKASRTWSIGPGGGLRRSDRSASTPRAISRREASLTSAATSSKRGSVASRSA